MMKLGLCFFLMWSIGCSAAVTPQARVGCAVVGGGIGGLTFAYKALTKCPSIAVFEASNRLGGRIETNRTISNRPIEFGAEIVDADQEPIKALIKELGIKLQPRSVLDTIRIFDREQMYTLKDTVPWLKEAIVYIISVIEHNNSALKNGAPFKVFDASDLKTKTLQMLEAFSRDEMGQDLKDLSYFHWGALKEIVERRLLLAKTNSYCPSFGLKCIQWVRPIQYTIEGGSEALIHKLADTIGRKNIYLDHKLVNIQKMPEGGYKLVFENGDVVEASKVVMALPFSAWRMELGLMNGNARAIFGDDLINLVRDQPYSAIRKVMLVPELGVNTKKPLSFGLDLDRAVEGWQQQFGAYSLMFGGGSHIDPNPFATQAEVDDEILKLSGGELQTGSVVHKLQPYAYSHINERTWNNYWKILSYPSHEIKTAPPVKLYARDIALSSMGTMFIVGEHVAKDQSGYMNSAVVSALWAAENTILSDK